MKRPKFVFLVLALFMVSMFVAEGKGSTAKIVTTLPLATGSSVDYDRQNIVSTDVSGEITFCLSSDGFTDIEISFIDGDKIASVESKNIQIIRDVVEYSYEERYESLAIYDYNGNVFVTVGLVANGSTYIYVATTIDDVQYSGMNLIGANEIDGMKRDAFEQWSYETRTLQTDYSENTTRDPYYFSVVPEIIQLTEKKDISIGESRLSPSSVGGTAYFLQHYRGDLQCEWNVRVGSEYVIPESWCSYEVRRVWPDKAQILGDLHTYTTQFPFSPSSNKYIGAYYSGFHGFHGKRYWWWWWEQVYFQISASEQLWPDDVVSCWSNWGYGLSRPSYAIVLAASCYSLWDSSMAGAFTNNGAQCYVGAQGLIPANLNLWIKNFLGVGLAANDLTVSAADSLYDTYNKFDWHPSSAGTAVLYNSNP